MHVLSAAYNPERPDVQGGHRQVRDCKHQEDVEKCFFIITFFLAFGSQTAVLGPLFMMMGRALERLATVPAGNVLAIAGVSQAVTFMMDRYDHPVLE